MVYLEVKWNLLSFFDINRIESNEVFILPSFSIHVTHLNIDVILSILCNNIPLASIEYCRNDEISGEVIHHITSEFVNRCDQTIVFFDDKHFNPNRRYRLVNLYFFNGV